MNRIFKTLALAAAITAMAVPAFAAESAPLHQTVKSLQKLEVKSAGSEHFTGKVVTAALYGPQAPSKRPPLLPSAPAHVPTGIFTIWGKP